MIRGFLLVALAPLLGCDKGTTASISNPSEDAAASEPRGPAAPPASESAASPVAATRTMPPRPVPTSSPTVKITMPQEVQLLAIQYMAAMQAPQPSDAPADPAYAKLIADQLRSVGKTDVISSGRRIDILLEKGCDAKLPRESVARRTDASLPLLLAHGVLVIRCADHALQCLQSTREVSNVLCTRK